jgi:hypothetical protein
MDFAKIFDIFTNYDLPCPEEIPFCNEWRQKYKEEIDKASIGGCTKCKLLGIKSKYMVLLNGKYFEKLQNKNNT